MILDHISYRKIYENHHPLFKKAFDFLESIKESDFEPDKFKDNKIEIDGDNCFALIFNGKGKGDSNILLESHQQYIDIQFVFKGSDLMGYSSISECKKIHTPYKPIEDYQLFDELPSTKIAVSENYFVIFYPSDAHAPLIGENELLKVVVKVRV